MEENNSLNKENLIDRLDRNLDWIKSCDTKASIVIAVLGVFLTIFMSENSIKMLKEILSQPFQHINFANFLYLLLFVVFWTILLYGVYCLIRVLVPKLTKDVVSYEGTYKNSLYFFEGIAKNSFLEFKDKVTNTTKEDEITDILSQVYINAKICTIKYSYYSKGIRCASLGIAGVIILYVIGMVLVMVGGFS